MSRPRSAIDEIAENYTRELLTLDPVLATNLGLPGHDAEWTDYSPDGEQARHDLARRTLTHLETATPADPVDQVTLAAMRERLGLAVEMHEAGLTGGQLRVIDCPAQHIREVFDLAPTDTEDDWAAIGKRLSTLPDTMDGYLRSLRMAVEQGRAPAARQVASVAANAQRYAENGFFTDFVASTTQRADPLPSTLLSQLTAGAEASAGAYHELARFLREEVAPVASPRDAVGRDAYRLWSREFLGSEVDLDETYEWGLAELARVEDEMRRVAAEIVPGGDTAEAIAALDADPARRLEGTDALRTWMQRVSDEAVTALSAEHFDIPEQIRRLECRIAPTQDGGIYYTGPSDDLSRPGRMWWSVPEGVTSFTTWQETTTVYHEGVPGHHLQIGQTAVRSGLLNTWRRMVCWVSGHGEGWALYAERLMDELGYLQDPGDRMGMLDSAAFRSARVVVDIGTHCGLAAPDEVGGGTWDAEKMWAFLTSHCRVEHSQLAFERDRYLGWPGQAPSYKVGERIWRQLREQARAHDPNSFDLKDFHRRALDVGSVGLEVLATALSPATQGNAAAPPPGGAGR
ncbi:MAG: DUF885 domain-containing protein [Actinomycetales bacterium]